MHLAIPPSGSAGRGEAAVRERAEPDEKPMFAGHTLIDAGATALDGA
jgi:hypothetical protein